MTTMRKLRGGWQALVSRRGMKPRCKFFYSKTEAEKWAREAITPLPQIQPDNSADSTSCSTFIPSVLSFRHGMKL